MNHEKPTETHGSKAKTLPRIYADCTDQQRTHRRGTETRRIASLKDREQNGFSPCLRVSVVRDRRLSAKIRGKVFLV